MKDFFCIFGLRTCSIKCFDLNILSLKLFSSYVRFNSGRGHQDLNWNDDHICSHICHEYVLLFILVPLHILKPDTLTYHLPLTLFIEIDWYMSCSLPLEICMNDSFMIKYQWYKMKHVVRMKCLKIIFLSYTLCHIHTCDFKCASDIWICSIAFPEINGISWFF